MVFIRETLLARDQTLLFLRFKCSSSAIIMGAAHFPSPFSPSPSFNANSAIPPPKNHNYNKVAVERIDTLFRNGVCDDETGIGIGTVHINQSGFSMTYTHPSRRRRLLPDIDRTAEFGAPEKNREEISISLVWTGKAKGPSSLNLKRLKLLCTAYRLLLPW